jgi:hypothetical protein
LVIVVFSAFACTSNQESLDDLPEEEKPLNVKDSIITIKLDEIQNNVNSLTDKIDSNTKVREAIIDSIQTLLDTTDLE